MSKYKKELEQIHLQLFFVTFGIFQPNSKP